MHQQTITREHIDEAVAFMTRKTAPVSNAHGIVLGSGMNGVADLVENPTVISYSEVPYMVPSTAPMHEGRFVIGAICGRPVICMQGRLHAYEGNDSQQIAFPVHLMHALGATKLIVTNAAGGINPSFKVGDLMLISDHVNLLGLNPCAGPDQPDLYPRFFDMTQAYAPEFREKARKAAQSCGIALKEGVYIATLGPSFETPAEIRAFRALGADAVGMSTVLEVIAARACGMEVLGISMISNPAAGVSDAVISMDDVGIAAREAAEDVQRLIRALFE